MPGILREFIRIGFYLRERINTVFIISVICCLGHSACAQNAKWKTFQSEGDTLYNHDDYVGAIKAYSNSIKASRLKEKEQYHSLYKRAVSYYSIGEFDLALKDLDQYIPKFPEAPRPLLLKAFIYRELGDEDKQLTYLQKSMDMDLVTPDLLKWRGILFLQKEEFQKSKDDFTLARQYNDDAEIETYLGLVYYHLEKPDSAFLSFNKSIGLNAMYLPAYLYAGSIALEEANYSLSLEYLNLALRLDPKHKEALYYKGVALIETEKRDEGCVCLNRAFYAGMDEAAEYLKQDCYESQD